MPNWVRNVISFSGSQEEIQEIRERLKSGENQWLSLDKMVPMPESIKVVTWGVPTSQVILSEMMYYLTEKGTKHLADEDVHLINMYVDSQKTFRPEISAVEDILDLCKSREATVPDGEPCPYERGKAYVEAMRDTGFTNWYDWSVENWGTKWDTECLCKPTYREFQKNEASLQYVIETAWSTPYSALIRFADQYPNVVMHVDFADEDIGSNCGSYGGKANEFWTDLKKSDPFRFASDVWNYDSEDFSADAS